MPTSWKRRHARGAVKGVLLDLLQEAGSEGLNARQAVQKAAAQGVRVDRTTLSSLLSRLKADNVVMHDGYRYRLRINENGRSSHAPAAFAARDTR